LFCAAGDFRVRQPARRPSQRQAAMRARPARGFSSLGLPGLRARLPERRPRRWLPALRQGQRPMGTGQP
jgi:hypothetical protein